MRTRPRGRSYVAPNRAICTSELLTRKSHASPSPRESTIFE